jgi:glycosyltransferase involved in cell wall biosynthesis
MPSYRQERYVRDALLSALAQDYEPLEIIVGDDASPDRSLAVVLDTVEGYRGPHSVRVLRSDRNRGIENYVRLYDEARGDLLVEFHNDDLAYPDRVSKLVAAWRASGASLLTSNAWIIGPDGARIARQFEARASYPTDTLDVVRDGWQPWFLGATFAYARELITSFAPLRRMRAPIENDWILPFRASLLRGIKVLDEPLLDYRFHANSSTIEAAAVGEGDKRIRQEALLAQRLGQFMYMFETLGTAPGTELAGSRLHEIRLALVNSILRTAHAWSGSRHALRAGRFRLRWLPPD